MASLLAGIGILGVAFGFASQDIAQNFIAGALLIFWRPFRAGDLIKRGDFFGFIESINMRSTTGISLLGHKSTCRIKAFWALRSKVFLPREPIA